MTTKPTYNHIPVFRFPEFQNDGEWKQLKFNDTFSFLPNNTLSRSELNYEKGIAQNIHYGDVLIKYGECVDVKKDVLPFITEDAVAQKYQYAKLQNGDVVIADTAEDETVGKCSEVIGLTDEFVVSGLHTMPVRPQIPFAQPFLGYYLNSESYRNQLRPLMQGVKVTSLSKSAISKTTIVCPKSIEEQRKIASCLSVLAEMIAATKEKLELLKAYKKGLMQKLFPAQGKTMPDYRFKEFEKDGEWEIKKLSELLFEHKTKSDGKCQVYSVSVSKGVINQMEYLGRNFAAADTSNYKLVKPYDIVYTKSPTGDFPYGIIKQSRIDHNVIVSPLYGVFSPINQYIGYIVHSYFESPTRTNNYLAPIIQKGAKNTIQISNDVFLSQSVCFPTNENEQCKIASCLLSLDETINAYSEKYTQLVQYKKGLMQQMFPTSK